MLAIWQSSSKSSLTVLPLIRRDCSQLLEPTAHEPAMGSHTIAMIGSTRSAREARDSVGPRVEDPEEKPGREGLADLALVLGVHLIGLLALRALIATGPAERWGLVANLWSLGAFTIVVTLSLRRVKKPSTRLAALVASGILLTSVAARLVLVAAPILTPDLTPTHAIFRTWAPAGAVLGLLVLCVGPSVGREVAPRWLALPMLPVLGAELGWRIAAAPSIGARPLGDGLMALARELALVAILAVGFVRRGPSPLPPQERRVIAAVAAVITLALLAEPALARVAGSRPLALVLFGSVASLVWLLALASERWVRATTLVGAFGTAGIVGIGLVCLAASGHPILTDLMATDLRAEPGSWPRGAADFAIVVTAFAAAHRLADHRSAKVQIPIALAAALAATTARGWPYGLEPAAWLLPAGGLAVSLGWSALDLRAANPG